MRVPRHLLSTIAAGALTLTLALGGCGGQSGGGSSEEPLKIGAIVSLTGTYAGLGQPQKNVFDLEVKRINASGGVNGRPIEVIVVDDGTDDSKAVAAASKLIEQDEVLALLAASGSSQTMAVRGDVTRAGIPQVSMAGATVITNPVDKLVFATPWSNTIVVPFTFDYLKKQGIGKIALISDSGGFGKDGKAVIAAEAPKAGVEIVADETFNPGDSDMTTQLTKIKNSSAQALVMWTAGKEAAIIAKNAQDLGVELPIYGSHGIARREFIEGAGAAAEGVRFAAGKMLIPAAFGEGTDAYQVATDFIDRYTEAYGEAPSTFAGYAYDALYLVVEAAKRAQGDSTPAALRDELEKTSAFVGVGGTFTMSPTDHNGIKVDDLTMYEIRDGEFTLAQ